VVIDRKGVREYNKPEKGIITDYNIANGLELTLLKEPLLITLIAEKKNKLLEGNYLDIYFPSGLPREKGRYKNNEKDSEWYYWNEEGKLIKRETWDKGKLVKQTTY
jgi:antitoxin component YwqK of YwqJK toxin-antitoxin module